METESVTRAQVLAAMLTAHSLEHKNLLMVYSVWEDGEITLEKGGELFGCRTLHCVRIGTRFSLDVASLPMPNAKGTHARVLVADSETANMLSFMFDAITD